MSFLRIIWKKVKENCILLYFLYAAEIIGLSAENLEIIPVISWVRVKNRCKESYYIQRGSNEMGAALRRWIELGLKWKITNNQQIISMYIGENVEVGNAQNTFNSKGKVKFYYN